MGQSLSDELVGFVESGVSVQIGTRDSALVPEAVRGVGAHVENDRTRVVVFVPLATGGRTVSNLADNRQIAVCFSRMEDHRTIQLKGAVDEVVHAGEEQRELVDRYRAEFARNLAFLGLPPRLSFRVASWPCYAIGFRVRSIWVQTPGPGAGEALREGAAS